MEKKVLSEDELPPHKRSHTPEKVASHSSTRSSSGSSTEADTLNVQSANNWEEAQLGDDQRKAKFLRLMGAAKKEHTGRFVIGSATAPNPHGRSSEEERQLEEKLESQFQHSLSDRLQHRNKKHRGLGFEPEPEADTDKDRLHVVDAEQSSSAS